jgi:GNAT superfamily N-acetyltransferase
MTDPTPPSAAQLRFDAMQYRASARIYRSQGAHHAADRDARAAAALDAEAARLEREAADAPNSSESPNSSPTLADACAYALEVCEHALNHDSASRLLNALIAAAEARGAAKERERNCTGGFTCGTLGGIGGVYCRICGGRVRVEGQ